MSEFEWTIALTIAAIPVGYTLGMLVALLWDMWRHPRSRWAEDAHRDIERARLIERRSA